jgi:hypothetical protein
VCEYGGQKEQQESDEGRGMNVSNIYVTYRFRRLVVCKQVGRLANSKRRRRWMESVEGGNGLLCWYILCNEPWSTKILQACAACCLLLADG